MAAPSSSFDQVKQDYDTHAPIYDGYTDTPWGIMERQLVASALGDCTGFTVLDLGGGTGLKARQVLEAGAVAVDVVDISREMIREGRSVEKSLGRADAINWYEADVSKPLDHLPLRTYDLVMANWVFDHAHDMDEYEGIWANVAARLKPGGRFVSVRSGDPFAACYAGPEAPYGVTYEDHEEVPGGIKFRYRLHFDPPITFEACSMYTSFNHSTETPERFGLEDVQVVPCEDAAVVREMPEFWALFLENPGMAVVKARKKMV